MIWLLTVPSAIALLLKGYAFWVLRGIEGSRLNPYIVIVFASLFITNVAEFLGIVSGITSGIHVGLGFYLRLYYVAAFSFLASFALFSLIKAEIITATWPRRAIYILTVMIGSTIAATDWIVAGYETVTFGHDAIVYSVIRIKGEYYYLAQTFIALCIASIITGLSVAIKTHKGIERRRLKVIAWSLSPLLVATAIVVFGMALGSKFNMTFLTSIATSIFLITLAYTEARHGLFGFLSKIPFTQEWHRKKAYWRNYETLLTSILSGEKNQTPWKSTINRAEHLLMQEVVNYYDGDIHRAAEAIDVSISTVRRKLQG